MLIDRDTIRKATNGEKDDAHTVSLEDIKLLPEHLENPIMVFKSATESNAVVVLTELKNAKGDSVIAAIQLSKPVGRNKSITINRIATVFGKERLDWFATQIQKNLLYRHKQRSASWVRDNGLQLPNTGSPTTRLWDSVPTELDLVKYRESIVSKSVGSTSNPTTVPALESAIKELTGTALPNQLGRIVATTASEIKSHWIAQVGDVNLESEGTVPILQVRPLHSANSA